MRLDNYWLFRVAVLVATLSILDARRVRVQPVDYDDDAAYYADPQDDGSSRAVVLVGEDGYYQPQARGGQDNYIPATHRAGGATRGGSQSFKDTRTQQQQVKDKAPPVQTIRNYNKVNDDGSFTFGYEAADGSFKEETRGTDCVVRGKYGYVDPDGNKREFTYVSGNPCDPNAVKDEDESRERPGGVEEDSAEPENVPANYPTRPIRPLRPQVVATTPAPQPRHQVYQQYAQEEEEVEEPQQILRAQPQPVRHRLLPARPTYIPEERPVIQARPRVVPSTTPSYEDTRPLTITPRPLTVTPTPSRPQPPATTYRPQLLQVAVTPRPALVYTTKQIAVQPQQHRGQPGNAARDFVAEYQKFQLDNQISSTPTPTPTHRTVKPAPPTRAHPVQADVQPNSNPVYSSELVFDPSSGQYKTALYQTLPQTEGEFTFNHRIQPYVHQPQPQLVNIRQLQQQSPLYRQAAATTPRATQAAYQAQQAEIQFQNSQQLFAQQQRARTHQHQQQQQQETHTPHAPRTPARTEPQQFYYIQPQALQGVSGGQIDAFLRGHNIQY